MTRSARALDGGVAAAAVNYDHLGAERPQIGKRIERPRDAFAFVQHGDDDRELRHRAPVPSACGVSRTGSKKALRRFFERAAAARSLAGGAAVAMAADPDRPPLYLGFKQIRQVQALARVVFERQIEHLIEIAVVDVAL